MNPLDMFFVCKAPLTPVRFVYLNADSPSWRPPVEEAMAACCSPAELSPYAAAAADPAAMIPGWRTGVPVPDLRGAI